MSEPGYESGPVLDQLKDFQRASVEHAFRQLYDRGADRFLVADEVGLGKTMVARGVIAKAIERLWDEVERIDIIYICSNAGIAKQNIRRLNVMPDQDFSFSSRMTMIARDVKQLEGNKVNFVSFTPGTSFDLKSSTGMSDERVLLYWLLRHVWGDEAVSGAGGRRLLQVDVGDDNWPKYLERGELALGDVDARLLEGFTEDVAKLNGQDRFRDLATDFAHGVPEIDSPPRHLRNELIGELRAALAKRCVQALEPDLVILDEFQRFRHLMSGESAAGQLAHDLFGFADNKTLLLSATPYKMFTRGDDADDNHHRDFTDTVEFLFNGRPNRFESAMANFRAGIMDVERRAPAELAQLRHAVEAELTSVMVRTERLGAGNDRNGMLTEVIDGGALLPSDVVGYVGLERLAKAAGAPRLLEFWKSVPSFLNFCDGYKFDDHLSAALVDPDRSGEARDLLGKSNGRINWESWRSYLRLNDDNGRYRSIEAQTVHNEAWRMLWIAPSLPYYELAAPWDGERLNFTKRLIFSSWTGVPKSVSSLLSYEVERRMFGLRRGPMVSNSPETRKTIRGLLMFRRDPLGRPGAMNSFAFVYPCITLAELGDPLKIAQEHGGTLTLDEMRALVTTRVEEALDRVVVDHAPDAPQPDKRWYWAAPLLLDRASNFATWMSRKDRTGRGWDGGASEETEDEGGAGNEIFTEHVQLAAAMYRGEVPLGERPDDLVDVLVDLALGSPATVALRSIGHALGAQMPLLHRWDGACRIGWAFRSLFNLPDVLSMVRSADWEQDYWRTATRYCADGCLTAVLDEYLHVLRESIGLYEIDGDKPGDDMYELAAAVQEAVGIRTTSLVAMDHLGEAGDTPRFRTRYAMRFGDDRAETEQSTVTSAQLRRAFNSPFWPFVLTSTSVGQEGLDFHLYCHAIVHWNLPSNPVDLEQREGRVHRFKGHAVRRNVAAACADAAWSAPDDPWSALFASAAETRGENDTELVPFWVFSGDAKIERHVPMLPMSREVGQLARLKRDVARYRLVFGQPRQDDLIHYLGDVEPEKLNELRIDLSPRHL
ncbi:MAG: DEAD/DEAH box helicase [Candidatus Microthrix sp.]|nr:DEAD/DEAH box helicase [Candidatus Microthrix sp.]